MLCENCGTEFNDTLSFCPVCGTPVQQSNPNPSMENTAYTMPNNGGYTMPNSGMYNPAPRQQVTSIGQYLGWFLLAAIPFGIGLIISIVFACMGENKNRANFFRAMLIIEAIAIVLCVIGLIIGMAAGFSAVTGFNDFDPNLFYDSYLAIASILGL